MIDSQITSTLITDYRYAILLLCCYGVFYLGNVLKSLLYVAYENHLQSGENLTKYGAGKGSFAIITGATDGIGKEFALQLAKAKMNLFLISRSFDKLQLVQKEIQDEFNVDVQIYALDFSSATSEDFQKLKGVIQSLKVGILINNVGTNHSIPTPFLDENEDVLDGIVRVNITGTLKMTKLVLPMLITGKSGLVLNVGSFAGDVPTPYLQTYSGSKAFLKSWSLALAAELNESGVHVEYLNTYFVVSNMSKIRKSSLLIPSARAYVKCALKKVGVNHFSTPYPYHNLLKWAMDTFLNRSSLIQSTLDSMKVTRQKALKKMQKKD